MKLDRRWLLAPPVLAVLLVAGPFRGATSTPDWLPVALTVAALGSIAATVALVAGARRPRAAAPTPPAGASPVRVVRTVTLPGGHALHVVRFDGHDLLVGAGPDGLRLLARATAASPTGQPYTIPAPERRTPAPPARVDGERLARYRALQPAGD